MLLGALLVVDLALFLYYVRATFIGQPYWDMFSLVQRYLQFLADGNVWSYLWEPHVQHRMVWMRLLTWFDAAALSGTAYPFVAFAVLCQAVTAWLLWRAVRTRVPGEAGTWLGMLTLMLVLTAVAAVDCALPINGIYPQALLLSVLALVFFDVEARPHAPWRAHVYRAVSLLAAMGAAFGNAAALAVWPLLLWLAWRSRAGRTWVVITVGVALVFGTAYLRGLPGAAEGAFSATDLLGLLDARTADYLLSYLGLPLTRAAALATVGKVWGAVLLVAGAGALVRLVCFTTAPTRHQRLVVVLVGFSLATAVLAAAGRSGIDQDVRVPVRYAVFVAPLHVGLLLLAWPWVLNRFDTVQGRRGLYGVAVSMAVVLLALQVASGQAAVATTRSMREVLARFAAGEETDEMKTVVYVDLAQARRDDSAIRAAGLYLRAR